MHTAFGRLRGLITGFKHALSAVFSIQAAIYHVWHRNGKFMTDYANTVPAVKAYATAAVSRRMRALMTKMDVLLTP
jgi:hypothetical protein